MPFSSVAKKMWQYQYMYVRTRNEVWKFLISQVLSQSIFILIYTCALRQNSASPTHFCKNQVAVCVFPILCRIRISSCNMALLPFINKVTKDQSISVRNCQLHHHPPFVQQLYCCFSFRRTECTLIRGRCI